MIVEFPAFILIGVYSPATRNESRDDFRLGFLDALDARVRNLVAAGKRVLLTGDLNIIRDEIDTANAMEQLKKHGMSIEQYVSTPARKLLNQLVLGGKVIGERDEGREKSIMWDLCRLYHPERQGMFTCWEQKINARPGNFGSRIDYVLCSYSWNDWFSEANIQEGLLGSDHCPVYAVLKKVVEVDGKEVDIRDMMSADMFKGGKRQREWSTKDLLPLSARLIPEFSSRRSIREMFTKKPSLLSTSENSNMVEALPEVAAAPSSISRLSISQLASPTPATAVPQPTPQETVRSPPRNEPATNKKRQNEASAPTPRTLKRSKSNVSSKPTSTAAKGQLGKGQSSLMGFFKPKNTQPAVEPQDEGSFSTSDTDPNNPEITAPVTPTKAAASSASLTSPGANGRNSTSPSKVKASISPSKPFVLADQMSVIDPIVAKESWSKLLGKRIVPRCEHNEDCISMKTKKAGENCGRYFYMCSRPLGPSGQKEKDTQWRCGTFIWSSDWAREDT